MSLKKPSESEEEFFARQDAEKRRRLALEEQKKLAKAERERLKQLHWMRCPKDGMELTTIEFKGVQIDKCFTCNGTFLDDGELERLAGKEPGFLNKVMSVFSSK
jgi:hypothetical protein